MVMVGGGGGECVCDVAPGFGGKKFKIEMKPPRFGGKEFKIENRNNGPPSIWREGIQNRNGPPSIWREEIGGLRNSQLATMTMTTIVRIHTA